MQPFLHPLLQIAGDILIEKVSPLYDCGRAAHSLNVVVVSAGLSGLTATHSLAQAQHRVTLLESTSTLGVRTGCVPYIFITLLDVNSLADD